MTDPQSPPLSLEEVYATLGAALHLDNATRSAAEARLRLWETDAAPNFIGSLLKVSAEVQAVSEESRLLATVIAKNAVGSSWRKTVASREWSRVPDDEKAYVRNTAVSILLHDPSDRVATQMGLLIANIARFDVPRPWNTLLPDLANAAAVANPATNMKGKCRALSTLKHVIRSLRNKRFIIDAPVGVDTMDREHLASLSRSIDDDRTNLHMLENHLLAPLRGEWEKNFSAAFSRSTADWEDRAKLATIGLSTLGELLLVVPDFGTAQDDLTAFLLEGVQAATSVANILFSGQQQLVAIGEDPYKTFLSKSWERLLQVGLVALDEHTLLFAQHLPAWISLCINTALLGMDANAVHHLRAKTRVLLTRFVARCLLQHLYRPEAERAKGLPFTIQIRLRAKLQAATPQLNEASACLDNLFTEENGHCGALVHAVVSKYLVLSSDDLQEWESDPEGFARQVDVETSPDADTPGPCGVALLECMMERNHEPVANALVALASQMQSQPLTPDNIMMREATYHAIGECFPHLRGKVDFQAWFENELKLILQSPELTGLIGDMLKARALWLIGVCGEELPPGPWAEAFSLTVRYMRSSDPVVSLMAVSAATALVGVVLEEQQFINRSPEDHRLWLSDMEAANAPAAAESLAAQANAEFNAHMDAINQQLDNMIGACFELLPQLSEIESMVRVVQSVSITIELMGDRLLPHLSTITTALPQVWVVIGQRAGEGTGAVVRLQSSLISLVAHLVNKLGATAMQNSHVAAIMLPLLEHATNVGSAESEPLLDDGLRLWLAILTSSASIPQELQQLLASRFVPLLRRGKDNAILFRIMEGYLMHSGLATIAPFLGDVAVALANSLNSALAAMQPKLNEQGNSTISPLAQDVGHEALTACSMLSMLQQLSDSNLPPELEAPVKLAGALVAQDYGGGLMRLPARSVSLLEACIEILSRLTYKAPHAIHALCEGNVEAENRLLDRWIVLSNARDVGELFIPALGAAGRLRRHLSAVALSALIFADACPGLRGKDRASQALALGLKAVRERRVFVRDQQKMHDLHPPDALHTDQVLLRRLELAKSDPLRTVDSFDAVRAAAAHVERWLGHEQLVAAMEAIDTILPVELKQVLSGHLAEDEEDAAAAEMQHVALKE